MLDPQQLRLLQEVAKTGSYSAAARSLGFTQPAITYQMKALEKAVRTPLTVRIGRTMRLTPAGETLLAHTERILAAMRAAESDLAALSRSGAPVVRLAAFPSSCATMVPAALVAMRRAFPGVEVQLVHAEPPEARTLVRRGDVEVALGYRFSDVPAQIAETAGGGGTLHHQEILVEDMHLVMPMDDPAASRRRVDIASLEDATFLLASPHFKDRLNRVASEAGFVPKVVMMADDYVAMQALVAAGFGVAFVPELALRAHRDPRIVSRTLVGWPRRHVRIMTWPDMLRIEPVQALVDHLATAGVAMDSGSPG